MSKLSNILKENFELKNELESMVERLKENEVKQQGFKVVQYSFLLSDSLAEMSEKPLKYMAEIFNIDKVALFIRQGEYAIANGYVRQGDNVYIVENAAFDYTFLEKRSYAGVSDVMIHKSFRVFETVSEYSFLIAPITDDGRIVGALGFYSSDCARFTTDQKVDFVNDLAFYIAIALKKLNNTYLLEMQAQTDYLTGLPNKSMLETAGSRWMNRQRDYDKPFVFMLLDLDNFKQVNDIKGHLEGDRVLKRAAYEIRRAIRDDDMLGRFGGDEFYLFVELADTSQVERIISRISKAMQKISTELNLDPKLGVSGGGVRVPDDIAPDMSFMEIVKKADERLYFVKGNNKGGFLGVIEDDNK